MDFHQRRFVDGRVLLIDKPLEWTSFDVVNKLHWALRNRLGVKKFKVGHAGTLDPLATVCWSCTGRATKAGEGLQSDAKSYLPPFDSAPPPRAWTQNCP